MKISGEIGCLVYGDILVAVEVTSYAVHANKLANTNIIYHLSL